MSQSIYGYRPDLAATLIFLIVFAISGVVHLGQGIKTRTWFFGIAMFIGCVSEVIGYASKMLLYQNVFSSNGFKISLVMLTLAPAFYCAGLYYTLKHIVLSFGSAYSRLPAAWYTYIFISCDVLSIVLQAIGGGISAAADSQPDKLDQGKNIMVAGLVLQVITLVIFGVLAADFAFSMHRKQQQLSTEATTLGRSRQFRLFLLALFVAYIAILIRCAYRVAELAGGWSRNNSVLRDEGLFIGLDSVPVAIATLVLNVWQPGWCFPKPSRDQSRKVVDRENPSDLELVGK